MSVRMGEGAEGENLQADFLVSVEPDVGLHITTHAITTEPKQELDAQLTQLHRHPEHVFFFFFFV